MENPWQQLPEASPYVLPIDRDDIDAFGANVVGANKLNLQSIPEPFIGNPFSASVIFLGLNPGDGPEDKQAHADRAFRAAMLRNLRHELQEHPFYALNPEFAWTPCAKWWTKNLHRLWKTAGLDPARIAQRLCVIEWFPYHSLKAGLPTKAICRSQQYSFELARNAINEKKLVVGLRAKKRWEEVDSCFSEIPYLSNPQIAAVSYGNAPNGLFDRIVEALR